MTVTAASPGKAAAPAPPRRCPSHSKQTRHVTPKKTVSAEATKHSRVEDYSSGKPASAGPQAVDLSPNSWHSIPGTDGLTFRSLTPRQIR